MRLGELRNGNCETGWGKFSSDAECFSRSPRRPRRAPRRSAAPPPETQRRTPRAAGGPCRRPSSRAGPCVQSLYKNPSRAFDGASGAARARAAAATAAARPRPVWKPNYGARPESPRRPPRHRRDTCSMAWRCDLSPIDSASMAAPSPRNDLVKNCRVHPTHWLISTQGVTGPLLAADNLDTTSGNKL